LLRAFFDWTKADNVVYAYRDSVKISFKHWRINMLGLIGYAALLIGVIWMVVVAIQTGQSTQDKVIWGLVCFFCSPLGSIVFFIMKKQGMVPLLLQIIGFIVMIVSGGFSFSMGNLPT